MRGEQVRTGDPIGRGGQHRPEHRPHLPLRGGAGRRGTGPAELSGANRDRHPLRIKDACWAAVGRSTGAVLF